MGFMKILTVLGTRPEIIRLSVIIKKLDKYCDHILVHTGQNFDEKLSDVFFKDMGLREPDYCLGVKAESFGEQVGQILTGIQGILGNDTPDRVLILGDTNSGLCSIVAKRMGIPVFHLEAGNRCYDDRVPEEVNRKIIDHCSTIHMPYTHGSKENLLREGIPPNRIYVVGNPITEVLKEYFFEIGCRQVLSTLELKERKYFLVTAHRAENVDDEDRLVSILLGLESLKYPVIVSTHPRTKQKIEKLGLELASNIKLCEPFGFFDFVKLERNALCVITDSGTVQEECSLLNIPNVTIRDVTERPETIECGSNIIVGVEGIEKGVGIALGEQNKWTAPVDYMAEDNSVKVIKILMGYHANL